MPSCGWPGTWPPACACLGSALDDPFEQAF
jgi:hypothetical protein